MYILSIYPIHLNHKGDLFIMLKAVTASEFEKYNAGGEDIRGLIKEGYTPTEGTIKDIIDQEICGKDTFSKLPIKYHNRKAAFLHEKSSNLMYCSPLCIECSESEAGEIS